jgi:hypothetical protein
MRYAILLVTMLLGSCGSNGNPSPMRDFALTVLPESSLAGGAAQAYAAAVRTADDGAVSVDISAAGAENLKALYFELEYDAAHYTPVAAQASGILAGAADIAQAAGLIELPVLDQPGTVTHGQVLGGWDRREGFSGNGVLATVRFAPRPFEPAAGAPRASSAETVEAIEAQYRARFDVAFDPATSEIVWYYSYAGDFDQNGVTAITDLSRFALFYGVNGNVPVSAAERNTAKGVADGDGNGVITISDLSRIGPNFNKSFGGYRIFHSPQFDINYPLKPEAVAAITRTGEPGVTLAEAQGNPLTDRLRFEFPTAGHTGEFFWVESDNSGSYEQSEVVLTTAARPWAPRIFEPAWVPVYEESSQSISFPYNLYADPNSNQIISFNDINTIGANFGEVGPFTPFISEWAADAYRDSTLDLYDFLGLGLLLNDSIQGFALFGTTEPAEVPSNPYAPELLAPLYGQGEFQQTGGPWPEYTVNLSPTEAVSGMTLWVRPVLSDGLYGTRSQLVTIP